MVPNKLACQLLDCIVSYIILFSSDVSLKEEPITDFPLLNVSNLKPFSFVPGSMTLGPLQGNIPSDIKQTD